MRSVPRQFNMVCAKLLGCNVVEYTSEDISPIQRKRVYLTNMKDNWNFDAYVKKLLSYDKLKDMTNINLFFQQYKGQRNIGEYYKSLPIATIFDNGMPLLLHTVKKSPIPQNKSTKLNIK